MDDSAFDEDAFEVPFSREEEFPQLRGNIYLDHAGSTLCARRQMEAFADEMKTTTLTNPHSRHSLSQATSVEVAKVRNRILQFFHTDCAHYTVIFTSGATAAMKLVAECFDFGSSGLFAHLREVHTSVLGMRQVAKSRGATTVCFEEEDIYNPEVFQAATYCEGKSRKLVVFPGQCNFSGRKYPLSWVKTFQENNWSVFLDAAALVSTSALNLKESQPNFVAISFYKIFGFPTGLGALLVRKGSEKTLIKTYFGGGAVELAVSQNGFHVLRSDFSKRMEDGTLPFLDIIALNHGFDVIQSLAGGMGPISRRTFSLARYTWFHLKQLRHVNGMPVVELYCDGDFKDSQNQGPVVAFNLKNSHGNVIGFATIEKVAESFNMQLRSGCFCNTGACQKYLGLTSDDLIANFHAGHVCGDSTDLLNGKPTGALRVSFGYMSNKTDAEFLLKVIRDVFVDKKLSDQLAPGHHNSIADSQPETTYRLTHLFIYPIKSCQGIKVSAWPVGTEGFLFDRKCFIQNSAGTSITLKHNSKLRDISASVNLQSEEMFLFAPEMPPLTVSVKDSFGQNGLLGKVTDQLTARQVTDSRVCGRPLQAVELGGVASQWLSEFLQDDVYSLLLCQNQTHSSSIPLASSAVNYAPFLVICSASLDCLMAAIPSPHSFTKEDLIQRMRPNLVVQTAVPFEEDSWKKVRIGAGFFEVVEKCSRCQMVNVSSKNGQRTTQPLQTIIQIRGKEMFFGILLRQIEADPPVHSASLSLRQEDSLQVVFAEKSK